MTVKIQINRILEPKEKYGKTYYPVVCEEIKGKNGYGYILNSLVPIPNDTMFVYGDIYTYDGVLRIGNIRLNK